MVTTATAAVTPTPLEARTSRGGSVRALTAKKDAKVTLRVKEKDMCARERVNLSDVVFG